MDTSTLRASAKGAASDLKKEEKARNAASAPAAKAARAPYKTEDGSHVRSYQPVGPRDPPCCASPDAWYVYDCDYMGMDTAHKFCAACSATWDKWTDDDHGPCISFDSTCRVLSAAEVDADGQLCVAIRERRVGELREGDVVLTGAEEEHRAYRRINRIWPVAERRRLQLFSLAPRCHLTRSHPVCVKGVWRKPEELVAPSMRHEEFVYNIELEGHVDTLLVDGVVVAGVGKYCGEGVHGWHVFTRKTVRCDAATCAKCDIAVRPEIDFSSKDIMRPEVFSADYEPY